jgi:GMP synthase (glutamine-hydrolysing)
MATFAEHMGVKVIRVDARTVHGALAGVADPEEKRKIIGREFVEVFQESRQAPNAVAGAGHDLPDVIESAGAKTGKAHVIKSTTTSAACRSACI